MRFCVPALCHSTLILIVTLSNVFSAKGGDINGTMNYDGKTRTYLLHVPPNYNPAVPTPLLLAFHGLTGDGALMADITQFSPLADQENFIVVYPDGLAQKWSGPNGSTDDVGFISALIDLLHTSYNIDGARTFAAGASNGGMFTYRLGLELADKITAIAAVSGYLPGYSGMPFPVPAKPVPVIHFHGTADATIPYSEAEEATGYWIDFDECISQPDVVDLPNADPSDGTTVNEMMYENGQANSEVHLYKINNGGHTWPGTASHAMPGKVCKDIDATSIIWNFFKSHSGAAVNLPPVVSITNPLPNISLYAPASLVIKATASDVDGSVKQVQFFNGSKSLKVDNTSLYTYVMKNMAAGVYTLRAVATDDKGAVASDTVIITVKTLKLLENDTINSITSFYNTNGKELIILKPDMVGEYDLGIYNVTGNKVSTVSHLKDSRETFSCNNLDAGIYFYRIEASDQTVVSGKFIVMR